MADGAKECAPPAGPTTVAVTVGATFLVSRDAKISSSDERTNGTVTCSLLTKVKGQGDDASTRVSVVYLKVKNTHVQLNIGTEAIPGGIGDYRVVMDFKTEAPTDVSNAATGIILPDEQTFPEVKAGGMIVSTSGTISVSKIDADGFPVAISFKDLTFSTVDFAAMSGVIGSVASTGTGPGDEPDFSKFLIKVATVSGSASFSAD